MLTRVRSPHRTWTRLAAGAIGIATAAAALAGCSTSGDDAQTSATDTINMSTEPWLGYGPWYIAQEKGYFADQGVTVNMTSFDDATDTTAGLGSGDIDVANAASHTVLQWLQQGQEGYIVTLLDTSMTADAVLAGPGIDSIADLKGKQVAFEEGSVSNLLLDHALTEAGMSMSDVTPVPMSPSDAAVALSAGRVDAAVTYEPYISDSISQNSDIKKLYTADHEPGLISDVLFVTKKAMEEKPDAVQKVVNTWGPAVDFYESDTEEAQQIIAENIGSDPSSLTSAFDGVKYFTAEDNKTQLGGDYLENVLPNVQKGALDAGIIDKEQDLTSLVDTRFVK